MLTEDQVKQFEQDGFLIIDDYVDPSLCDQIREETDQLIAQKNISRPEYWNGIRIKDGWRVSKPIRDLALNPTGLAIVNQLLNAAPFPFQTLNFPIGTEQPLHSDTMYFNSDPAGYMAGLWVALEDVDETNGALQYCPGSHKLKEITMDDLGLAPGSELYPRYEEEITRQLQQHNIPTVTACMKKGQAFLWHANLLHGGSPKKDPASTRYSQVTHFFCKGMKYYMPWRSSAQKRHFRPYNPARLIPGGITQITHGAQFLSPASCDYIG